MLLFSFVDLYHLIAYFTAKKYKVHHATINPIKQLSQWDGQKTKSQPSEYDAKINTAGSRKKF